MDGISAAVDEAFPELFGLRGRVERYLTNPAEEPDPAKWEVDVAYLTKAT